MTETVNREEMKPGERYKVEFEGEFGLDNCLELGGENLFQAFAVSRKWIPPQATITRLPPKGEPLKIGESVLNERGEKLRVLAAIGFWAWCLKENNKPYTCEIFELHRPSGLHITETE